MSRLPFNIHRDAIFRQREAVYFDPLAPRRRPMRSEDNPFLARLDSSDGAPPVTTAENVLILAVLAIMAVAWFVAWMIGARYYVAPVQGNPSLPLPPQWGGISLGERL